MALETDFTDVANAMKIVLLTVKDDLDLTQDDIYLFEVPQNFKVPAIFIEFVGATINRVHPGEGHWIIRWLVTIIDRELLRADRQILLYNKLCTIIKTLMRNPSMRGVTIDIEAHDSSVDVYGDSGTDQANNAASFLFSLHLEPVDITPVELCQP